MGRVHDTISNVNAAIRNLLLAVLIGGLGYGGYKAYDAYSGPREELISKQAELDKALGNLKQANDDLTARQKEVAELNSQLKEKIAQVERLEVRMKLLKVQHRLARLTVLDQKEAPSPIPAAPTTGTVTPVGRANVRTSLEFVEINEQGEPIGPAKKFGIEGDMVYVDYLHVTFDDKFIETADLDRSTSIVLFQRIFGGYLAPVKGFELDTVGTRPTAYARGTKMSDFEKKIWDDFWLIANDPKKAADMGIHAAQGSAVSMRVQPGVTYEIELRSTGELTFLPVKPKTPPQQAAEAKKGG
jgi:hypothetical protein